MSQNAHITDIARQAAILVGKAQALGLVLTITNKPIQPLAMGNHAPDIDVRPALERKDTPMPLDARASSKTTGDQAWAESIAGKPPIEAHATSTGIAQLMDVLESLSANGQVEILFMGPEPDTGSVH